MQYGLYMVLDRTSKMKQKGRNLSTINYQLPTTTMLTKEIGN